MNTQKEERTILAVKLHSKASPDHGVIRPIAEYIDDQLHELNNFCHTNQVFIPVGYQTLNDKFREGEVFRISINISEPTSTIVDPYEQCKYKAQGTKAERLKPKDLIEIIDGELPDKNNRYFEGQLPSTEYIFIRDKAGDCFGPFSWEHEDDGSGFNLELLNDTPLLKSSKISRGQIFKIKNENFNKYSFSFSVENKNYHFILNISGFINNLDHYEYASDEEVVQYCSKLASEIGSKLLTKTNWDSLKKLASNAAKLDQTLSKNRLEKLSQLSSDIFIMQGDIRENIGEFLKSTNGKLLIQNFIDQNRDDLLKELRDKIIAEKDKDIMEKEEEVSSATKRINEKNKEFKELSAEVERKRNETKQDVVLEDVVREKNKTLITLDFSISEKEKKLLELDEKLSKSFNLDNMEKEIEDKKAIIKHYEKENLSIKEITEKLNELCKENEDKLRIRLTELKPFVDHINGSFFANKTENNLAVFVKTHNLQNIDALELQSLVVETVKHNLRLKSRYFESWQVANLLISTQQSFITFFAGLPGVGKTSLARLIAQSQQLEPRLQEVSVARGWTSQKDLIGFYNPLSNRFQSSNTGLHSFIESLSLEKKDEQAMAYVLLDEANLSPIEHYWSAFMAMADGEGERMLRLGQDILTVPSTLRFLATINYDGTTEPLSPRVVDRAPVIVMEANDILQENDESLIDEIIALPLSAIEMNKLFGWAEKTPDFQYEEGIVFNKVRQILSDPSLEKGRPLSISQRKEIVIRQYCAQAGSLMRSFGCEDLKALDLAILQHILPQVRGNGQNFAKRLTELKQTCSDEGLKESAKYLDRMLAYGETELHSYDFFCW